MARTSGERFAPGTLPASGQLVVRHVPHHKDLYQFEIGDVGPGIGDKLEGVTGVLGWSALRAANTIL